MPLQVLRAPQREDRRHRSWRLPEEFLERAFACDTPSSPLAVLAERVLRSCNSPHERLEALTTLLLSSYLSKVSYVAARDALWGDISAGALECTVVVGAVVQALAHAAALEPRDFERENATLGATRLLRLLTLSLGAHSRFDAQNTVLQEVVQRELNPLRELPAAEALMSHMEELVQTPRTEIFDSQSAAWRDAHSQLEALHRLPFGAYPGGAYPLHAIGLALHGIGRAALAAPCTLRGASEADEALPALAARLLKLVSEALRRRGLMLHMLAQPERAAAAWADKQKQIEETMLRDPAMLADLGTLAQANLEDPAHWPPNARHT